MSKPCGSKVRSLDRYTPKELKNLAKKHKIHVTHVIDGKRKYKTIDDLCKELHQAGHIKVSKPKIKKTVKLLEEFYNSTYYELTNKYDGFILNKMNIFTSKEWFNYYKKNNWYFLPNYREFRSDTEYHPWLGGLRYVAFPDMKKLMENIESGRINIKKIVKEAKYNEKSLYHNAYSLYDPLSKLNSVIEFSDDFMTHVKEITVSVVESSYAGIGIYESEDDSFDDDRLPPFRICRRKKICFINKSVYKIYYIGFLMNTPDDDTNVMFNIRDEVPVDHCIIGSYTCGASIINDAGKCFNNNRGICKLKDTSGNYKFSSVVDNKYKDRKIDLDIHADTYYYTKNSIKFTPNSIDGLVSDPSVHNHIVMR